MRLARTVSLLALTAALGLGLSVGTADAAPRHKSAQKAGAQKAGAQKAGVRFAGRPTKGGYQTLVSDGPGSGFGFHRLPGEYRVGARVARNRQSQALREAVETDYLTTGGFRSGFPGDSVYGSGPNAAYGVYNGSDGYGSPYFAGYYGPGDGEDLGPLGHTYSND